MAQAYTYIVAFTVDQEAIAGDFVLTDAVAQSLLTHALAGDGRGKATVLHAPNPAHIANIRGLSLGNPARQAFIDGLRDGAPKSATLQAALLSARSLMNDPALVTKAHIDPDAQLKLIEAALVELVGEL